MSQVSQSISEIEALCSPRTHLADISAMKVSKRSSVYDALWDFTGDLEHRPRSITPAKLKVNWEKWPFSTPLQQEMQRIFCIYIKAPKFLSGRSVSKPNTFCMMFNCTLTFLSDVVLRFPSPELIESLDHIEWHDLNAAASSFPVGEKTVVRRGLRTLFHPGAAEALGTRFQIGPQDIDQLKFKEVESKPADKAFRKDLEGPAMMPDELFTILSDEASGRLKDFLQRLGMQIEDGCAYNYQPPLEIAQIQDFPEAFRLYEHWRRAQKLVPISDLTDSQTRYKLKKLGVRLGAMQSYLREVNIAAQIVLGMYMGARGSELTSIRAGCLTERDDVPCIIGRNFKGKEDSNIYDDTWVALPVMRDAVRALEALARLKNNTYLYSSTQTAGGTNGYASVRNNGEGYSLNSFAKAVQNFIRDVSPGRAFRDWSFNSHQFKHSLARQLVKAKLGLPYISFHLKHLHSRIATLPSDVTLGYGNAGKILQSESAGLRMHEARRELATKIFDPDSMIQGGAAAEFDERRKAYFKGMTDSGMTKEQIINELAELSDSSFVNVGLGFCTGRKDNPDTGEKPPCIGSLRCNPNQCSNAIVTKEAHGPAWKKVFFDNRRMANDSRFAYGRAQFEAAADEARDVLRRLDVRVDDD